MEIIASPIKINTPDLRGMRFDRLVVLHWVDSASRGSSWMCLCDCGNTTIKSNKILKAKHTLSCGCSRHTKSDLIGQVFGRLTVTGKATRRYQDGSVMWDCLCQCGNTTQVPTHVLKKKTRSCGCEIKEIHRKRLTTHGQSRTLLYQRDMGARKRAIKRNATVGPINPVELDEKLASYGYKCAYCKTGEYEELDHVIPLSRNGEHSIQNLLPACRKCNGAKKAKLLFTEWSPPVLDERVKLLAMINTDKSRKDIEFK